MYLNTTMDSIILSMKHEYDFVLFVATNHQFDSATQQFTISTCSGQIAVILH